MTRFLLDSGIGIPVLAELVAGIEHSRSRDRNIGQLHGGLHRQRPFRRSWADG